MFCSNCGKKMKPTDNYCYSCGIKIENHPDTEKQKIIEKNRDLKPQSTLRTYLGTPKNINSSNYKDIFYKIEAAIKKECSFSEEEFEKKWDKFKKYNYKNYSDNDIYWIFVPVAFYAGMKAAIVTPKLPAIRKYFNDYKIVKDYSQSDIDTILNDPNTIHYKRKIEACIENAKTFDKLVTEYGSFINYLESFGDLQDDRTLDQLKNALMRFEFIGPVTAYHVMLDLGLNVWKPDRVICRILFRLGLIDNESNIEQAVTIGKEFSRQIQEPIRYIDIIMVKYGQVDDEEGFGLKNGGICLKNNPRCNVCGVNEYCRYKN